MGSDWTAIGAGPIANRRLAMENHFAPEPFDTEDHLRLDNKTSLLRIEAVAMVALEAGKMLMEAGANAKSVESLVQMVARGLGAERVDLRIGYASLSIKIEIEEVGITRMRRVGSFDVNQRLIQGLWELGKRVAGSELTVQQADIELTRLATETTRRSCWVIAVSASFACAAFGRLLGVDWYGSGAVFIAAAVAQVARGELLRSNVNAFLCARWAGSATPITAMIASILLLVPGVPGFAAKAIIGLFALTTGAVANESDALIAASQNTLRVLFTMGAIGTGLAIPASLLRVRASR